MLMKRALFLVATLSCICSMQAKVVNLTTASDGSTITLNTNDTLTGISGAKDIKVQVAKGAHVYLRNAFLNHTYKIRGKEHAGISLLGNGIVYLIGENVVNGFGYVEPGIYVPRGCCLRIAGEGKLMAASGKDDHDYGRAAGIGAGGDKGGSDYKNRSCGDIEIRSGVIIAKGGYRGAGIGGGCKMSCGNITIFGGTVTAEGGPYGAGIGAGGHDHCSEEGWYTHCEDIDIYGGNIKAVGGYMAAGIGGGAHSKVKNITINDKNGHVLEKVIAIKGNDTYYSVGKGGNEQGCHWSSVESITVAGVNYPQGIPVDVFEFPEPVIPEETPACAVPTDLECISHTATSAYIAWEPSAKSQKRWYIAFKKRLQSESAWDGHYCDKQFENLTNLQADTEYEVKVFAQCDDSGESDYSEKITFRTDKAEETAPVMPEEESKQCSFPRYFDLAEVTQTTATFSWVPWYDSDSEWELRLSDGTIENVKYYSTTDQQYTFTGLQSDKQYAVRVRTVCGPNDKSTETVDIFFKTLATPADCKAPNDVDVVDVRSTSAVVTWNRGSYSQNRWKVKYKKTTASTWYYETVSTDSHTLTDLIPNTPYEVYVIGICDGVEGGVSQTVTFTTAQDEEPEECKAPIEMATGIVTDNSALVFWSPQGTETKWYLIYKRTADANYMDVTVRNNPYYQFINLEPNTSYSVNVYAICSDDSWSPWYNDGIDFTFTTAKAEGIDAIHANKIATKILRDGQLFILVGDKLFDAQGKELK